MAMALAVVAHAVQAARPETARVLSARMVRRRRNMASSTRRKAIVPAKPIVFVEMNEDFAH